MAQQVLINHKLHIKLAIISVWRLLIKLESYLAQLLSMAACNKKAASEVGGLRSEIALGCLYAK
jgi:hypothetical protein